MGRAFCVGVILLLGFGAFTTRVEAQSGSGNRGRGSQLEQNYPNPFNPVTRIPFTLSVELFEDGGSAVVTIRIYNVLRQLVATPTALNHPAGNGALIDRLQYTAPGRYLAYWDGTDKDGKKVGSGLYFAWLEINGRRVSLLPMTVAK